MTIRISVKGNEAQAREAARARGIPQVLVFRVLDRGEMGTPTTILDAPDSKRAEVVRWFCEPAVCDRDAGFPVGTMTFHS